MNQKPNCLIILPSSRFKLIWNFVIILLLLYTSTYVPYRVAFVDESTTAYQAFEYCIDALFLFDIFVNFCSAIEKKDGTIDVRMRQIAKSYLTSWFMLDLCATFPT